MFLLSNLFPFLLLPPPVQVAHRVLSRRMPAAELGAEHSTRYGTGRAKMQTTEMISRERHPHAEGVWGKKKKSLGARNSPCGVRGGGGHSCNGNGVISIARLIKCVFCWVVVMGRGVATSFISPGNPPSVSACRNTGSL